MSYSLYDVNGYVADMATTSGLDDLRRWMTRQKNTPHLTGFLREGAALLTPELVEELDNLKMPVDEELRSTLEGLKESFQQCDTIAIINNGIDGDGEEEET